MSSSDKGGDFLSRWSKRKQAVKEAEEREQQAALPPEPPADQLPGEADRQDQPPVPTEADVEALTADSDFSVFLKDHVPDHIKRLALRKLWASDPIFNFLDGMNEYDDDYTKVQLIDKAATSYKIGRGYQPEEAVEEEEGEALVAGEDENGEETAGPADPAKPEEEPPDDSAEGGDRIA